jgi:hypothetical protein
MGNGNFTVGECCDFYYDLDLTKGELIQLAREIEEFANAY